MGTSSQEFFPAISLDVRHVLGLTCLGFGPIFVAYDESVAKCMTDGTQDGWSENVMSLGLMVTIHMLAETTTWIRAVTVSGGLLE